MFLSFSPSSARRYELKTIMYLKISISDFLTLFSARTRTWFWERCLSRPLAIAFVIATGASTFISLFWGDIFSAGGNYMAPLRQSGGAVVFTWIYCVIWWFVQDAAKVLTYHCIDTYLDPASADRAGSSSSGSSSPVKVVANPFGNSARRLLAAANIVP